MFLYMYNEVYLNIIDFELNQIKPFFHIFYQHFTKQTTLIYDNKPNVI